MTLVAAFLAGWGGLLLEIVLVRRYGLLLGNTSWAAAVVLGAFLGGLGLGGRIGPVLSAARSRPRAAAAVLYGGLALAILAADFLLARAVTLSWTLGLAAVAAAPGLLAVGMGAAFPLLFARGRGGVWRAGGLMGANLAGSVLATAAGANVLVPELGISRTAWIAATAYAMAAVALALASLREPAAPPIARSPVRPLPGRDAYLAFASGLVVLGFEVLLLRRLPFFLEGFTPTLAGVLAAALLGLTLGSALVAPALQRLAGADAAGCALGLGALAVCAGLHEHAAPALARSEVSSDLGMHARILAASLVAGGPVFVFLGAVVPLCVARAPAGGARAVAVGRLFFWQGLGSLGGALLVGHVLPLLAPDRFFAVAPLVLALSALVPGAWAGARVAAKLGVPTAVALATLGVAGAGTPWSPEPPVARSRWAEIPVRRQAWKCLEHRTDTVTTASVVYDRRRHRMRLFTDEFAAAETGPGTAYMKALGHLPFLLRPGLRRAAVIALGTGTTADAVRRWRAPGVVHVVDVSAAVLALSGWFSGDGPVMVEPRQPAFLTDVRARMHVTDGRRFLARRAPGSLDLITMEPLLPYAPKTTALYSMEFYAIARRALAEGGLVVQWVPTHALPSSQFATLLRTFAISFPHTSVWLVDQATLLVGSRTPHVPTQEQLAERLAGLPTPLRRALHRCGIVVAEDLRVAFVGDRIEAVVGDAELLHDDRPFLERVGYWSGARRLDFPVQNLETLAAIARAGADGALGDAAAVEERSRRLRALRAAFVARARLFGQDLRGGREAARAAVRGYAALRNALPGSVLLHREETQALRRLVELEVMLRAGRGAAAMARAHLRRDPGSALCWACLALDDPRRRSDYLERARALDPLLFRAGPAFLRELGPVPFVPSPLEELALLPGGERLAREASASGPRGLALRAAFPVRVGHALVDELRRRPLQAAERDALRDVLDPRLWEEAARAVEERRGDPAGELLDLWRRDLAMPEALARLASGDRGEKLALAAALEGHRGRRARACLARLMVDPDPQVRTAAAITVARTFPEVPYDPDAAPEHLQEAARRVR